MTVDRYDNIEVIFLQRSHLLKIYIKVLWIKWYDFCCLLLKNYVFQ